MTSVGFDRSSTLPDRYQPKFLLAVVTHYTGPIVSTKAEAFSRASTNLSLLAIALVMAFPGSSRST